jgi:hypothetical protein
VLLAASLAAAQNARGPGRIDVPLIAGQFYEAGTVTIHNNNGGLLIDIEMANGWHLAELHVHAGWADNPVPMKSGNPIPGKFDHKFEYGSYAAGQEIFLDFAEDLQGFRWGGPYEAQRTRHIAVHADVVLLDAYGKVTQVEGAWARGDIPFEGGQWGWWLKYLMAHKAKVHFVDAPVAGLRMTSPTEDVLTDDGGGAPYFPGESGTYSLGGQLLGSTMLDHKVSPLDLFPGADIEDPRVANMAMLLQSLDADGNLSGGIQITPEVTACFNDALAVHGPISDWTADAHVDALVDTTITNCPGLVTVSREDAVAHLDKTLNSNMFRKNISRTPELGSSKSKLNVMGMWFPARKANGDLATYLDDGATVSGIPYYDADGNLLRVEVDAKPLVAVYTDADPVTGAHDIWGAVSRDDGTTWKRKNLSRAGDRSSFTLDNGMPFYGEAKKPVMQVQGNKILVAWTSKYCRGGRPAYSIKVCPDADGDGTPDSCMVEHGYGENYAIELDYPYDDPYWQDDIWGVAGPQRSHDYTDEGYPEVGEVPYSCVWTARGLVATQADVNSGVADYVGDIVWFKPERLTSGRRDANQVFMGGASGAGFAIAWQEDPGGLRPGEAKGPGPGWGGATTNHKTDIWYSYLTMADHSKVDTNFVSGGDPQHDHEDLVGRPKALVPMSLPVRLSDNDVVNTDNMMIALEDTDGDGIGDGLPIQNLDGSYTPVANPDAHSEEAFGCHRYGYMLDGLWNWDGQVQVEGEPITWDSASGNGTLYEFVNQQDATKRVVVTPDGRPLDGNTGASRPNLFLQAYVKQGDNPATPAVETEYKSAWAILAYEETKGMGSGPPEDNGTGEQPQDGSGYDPCAMVPDEGKNVIYHSFDFTQPDVVSAGTILNLPETDGFGTPLYVQEVPFLGAYRDGDGNVMYNPDGTPMCIPNPDAGLDILDWKGDLQLAYENARRPRFLLQGKDGAFGGKDPSGNFKEPGNSGTVLIVLYKEGQEGQGRPSDILARRCVVKNELGQIMSGNPYRPANFVPQTATDTRVAVQNLSTVIPGTTWINPDRDPKAKGDGVKVCDWTQPVEALANKSGANPYEDARAHRGGINGDFVILGYSYTPNWAASRNAHDKYDFYIRRSFDGGETWTTDPDALVNSVHTDIFFNPEGISQYELNEMGDDISEPTKHYEVVTEYGPGVYEPARNVSLLKNNKTSVIEPRLVKVPGTIKDPATGEWTGKDEDKNNPDVFYVVYGTSTNLKDVEKAPEDLFMSFSKDRGTTLALETWIVNPESDGNYAGETVHRWFRLAKDDPEQGEAQIRMTPDGSRFYSSWVEEGEEGSDIMFRRIMPAEFEANVAETTEPTTP